MKAAVSVLFLSLVAFACGAPENDATPSECSCSAELCGCPAEACQCVAPVCDCPDLPVRAAGSIESDGTLLGLAENLPIAMIQRTGTGQYWIGVDAQPATTVLVTPRAKAVVMSYRLYSDGVAIEIVDLSGKNTDCEFSFAIEQTAQMVP